MITIKNHNTMKTLFNIAVAVVLFLSMLYVGAVDSMSNFEILSYGGMLAGLWYGVSQFNKKIEMSK